MNFYLLDRFNRQLGRRNVVRQRVLVDVQSGQPERHLGLQFGCKALLRHIVAALHVQVVEGIQVALCQLRGGDRHEGHAEQAAQLVRTGSGGYLQNLRRPEITMGVWSGQFAILHGKGRRDMPC